MGDPQASFDNARRAFLLKLGAGLGWLSAAELLGVPAWAQAPAAVGANPYSRGALTAPHFPPTAKRVIYMHMLGAVSHVDTFDYKPMLEKMHGQELPESVRGNRRLSTMVKGQTSYPIIGPIAPVQARRQERDDDQRPDGVHARRSPTTSASSARCTPST